MTTDQLIEVSWWKKQGNQSIGHSRGRRWGETINGNQQEAHWRLGKILYSLLKNISVCVDLCHNNKSMQQIKQHWPIARPTMLSTGLTEQKQHPMSRCIGYSTLQYSRVHLYYRKITLESIQCRIKIIIIMWFMHWSLLPEQRVEKPQPNNRHLHCSNRGFQ